MFRGDGYLSYILIRRSEFYVCGVSKGKLRLTSDGKFNNVPKTKLWKGWRNGPNFYPLKFNDIYNAKSTSSCAFFPSKNNEKKISSLKNFLLQMTSLWNKLEEMKDQIQIWRISGKKKIKKSLAVENQEEIGTFY